MSPVVEAIGLSRSFKTGAGRVAVLRDLDLTIERGETVMLQGRSGSGKTTLLNIISGIDRPDGGGLQVCGTDMIGLGEEQRAELRRSSVSFVFQSFGLLPVLSAAENIEVPLRLQNVPNAERDDRVDSMLDAVGLRARAKHRPGEMSGGEQQRVAIARALAARPRLLIADEPTGQLDATTGRQIMDLLAELATDGLSMLIATHDAAVGAAADRRLDLTAGRIAPAVVNGVGD